MPTRSRSDDSASGDAGRVLPVCRPARQVMELELAHRQRWVGRRDPRREGVDRPPPRADTGRAGASSATAPGPARCGGRHAGRSPLRRAVPAPMAATTSSCSSSSRAARVRRAAGVVESADVLGQQGIVAHAAGDHGVGQADHHDTIETQAPGPTEGGHEHPVAESAVGEVRGVEGGLFEQGVHCPPEGAVVGALRHGVELAQSEDRSPAPGRWRRARRGAMTPGRCRGSGRGAPPAQVAWVDHDPPGGVARVTRSSTNSAMAPAAPARSACRSARFPSRSRHWTGPRTTPASEDTESHRLAGMRPRPGPDTMGAVESHATTSWRAQSEAARSSRPSTVAPATVRSRCRVSRSVDGHTGCGQLLVQRPDVAGTRRMEDGLRPCRDAGVDRRPPRHGPRRAPLRRGRRRTRTSVKASARRLRPPTRSERCRSGPRRRRGPVVLTEPWCRARATSTGPSVPSTPGAPSVPVAPSAAAAAAWARSTVSAKPRRADACARRPARAQRSPIRPRRRASVSRMGRGASPQLGDAVAQRHQAARVPDEIGQPTPGRQGPGADGLEIDRSRYEALLPRAASTGTPSWRISLSTVVQLTLTTPRRPSGPSEEASARRANSAE